MELSNFSCMDSETVSHMLHELNHQAYAYHKKTPPVFISLVLKDWKKLNNFEKNSNLRDKFKSISISFFFKLNNSLFQV